MKKISEQKSAVLDDLESEISPIDFARTQTKMHLAVIIDEAIKRKGWNKIVFASKVGQTPSVVTKWLSGTHNFTVDTLTEIGNALGIDLFNFKIKAQQQYPEQKIVFQIRPERLEQSLHAECYNLTLKSMVSEKKLVEATSKTETSLTQIFS